MTDKIRVAVLYGGRSGEHEVSLQSAASVIRHLDRTRFEVIPVSIDKAGRWQWNDLSLIEARGGPALAIAEDAPEIRLAPRPGGEGGLLPVAGGSGPGAVDVVFPVLHGPLCEDGTVQGLLELAEVAYVGSGVLASAVSMDKDIAKRLAALAGIPVAPYHALTRQAFARDPAAAAARAREGLTLPVFVKPCNMGSSVGVHKVKAWDALEAALADAFQYDLKVLVEQGIDAREIEVAVLEGEPLHVSLASELNPSPHHDFYSYEAKYLDPDGATVDLPARLEPAEMDRVRGLAAEAFAALECSGLARVDFFLDRQGGGFFFNEINTLPGFTAISMYPKMMEASGVPYPALLSRLIDLALERHRLRHGLKRERL
ncbi:D-alanine--D-alanine ligase family protein [Methylobacterium sp. NEAU 140]|uniref:D-alanine--D-alanine ligase family protein n=1 Tax=Methylobacterium sp. NEAU 140 TaxID=3064945 RepID=UPI0027343729|nr:D-alanine--D-alanine ligase family protein [Methylobacterium sp. NEAU 140]MDP4022831.1 D-alanine--D-alanine ligase family protein [Methylobacterium sp. NEAU 140]